jgi:hypothetical protein
VFKFDDLSRTAESDPIWELLKKDSLREKLFDLIIDLAALQTPATADMLTNDALRASAARIEFAMSLNARLPKSPEANQPRKKVNPSPVE